MLLWDRMARPISRFHMLRAITTWLETGVRRLGRIIPHKKQDTPQMNSVVRNILAVLAGLVAGSFVNIALVNIGPIVVPLPEGADVSTMETLRDSMALFTPANFLFPFLGHAVGTLAGAFVAAKLAASHPMKLALGIGVFFLVGGIAAIQMIGGPLWFQAADLLAAYIPMGYLGGMLAGATRPKTS